LFSKYLRWPFWEVSLVFVQPIHRQIFRNREQRTDTDFKIISEFSLFQLMLRWSFKFTPAMVLNPLLPRKPTNFNIQGSFISVLLAPVKDKHSLSLSYFCSTDLESSTSHSLALSLPHSLSYAANVLESHTFCGR